MKERQRPKKGKGDAMISRRTFLKGMATGTGAAALGGIPGILSVGQAPAYAKGTKLHLLQWLNFVPAGDKVQPLQ